MSGCCHGRREGRREMVSGASDSFLDIGTLCDRARLSGTDPTIWKVQRLWVGFLKCAHQTVPHSFPVLLQLPMAQLEDALTRVPDLRPLLVAHVSSQPNIRSTIPRSTITLLGLAGAEAAAAEQQA
ncbi:hypothetical protein CBR_g40839 [Chara braunii]|uniref:Symplekin C-terminal domain-containing protein n=1 Tax=Chara braunii TaxID=69332 RepID=A0A388K260_CHABU|nr:hypothetical protein CBR_g40839 [Chara braunii]|eukprot:GBG64140.1 hypothetical protein CBR_g40839 [Chara braunii]